MKVKNWKALLYFLKVVCPMSWRAVVCSFCSSALKAAAPMVTLVLSSRLLASLTVRASVERILLDILALLLFGTAAGVLQALLNSRFKIRMDELKDNFTLYVGKRLMKMQYGRLESPEVQDLRQQALLPILRWGNFEFVFQEFVPAFIGGVITAAATIVLLAEYKLWLVFPILLTVTIHLFLSQIQNERFQKVAMTVGKVERKLDYYDSVTNDFTLGKDIRLFRIDKILMNKIRELNDKEVGAFAGLFYSAAVLDFWETLLVQVQIYFVYAIAAVDLIWKTISIDVFFRFTGLFINFGNSLFQFMNALVNLHSRSRFLEKFVEFDEIPVETDTGRECCGEAQPVEFSHVSFGYEKGKEILTDVSFSIPAGKAVALVGENGSGKTTIAKLLSGFLTPTAGQVYIGGAPLFAASRSSLSAVYQDFQLFAFTVRENVETDYAGRGDMWECLDSVGLKEIVGSLPEKEETYLYKSFETGGTEFSYGQGQKLATARSLYKNAGIILLDEPTSAFDAKAEYEIFRDFRRLIDGKTALLISHRLWSCRFCDEILVLSGGRIAERGSHEELMGIEDGIYRKMFLAQAQYYEDSAEA